MSQVAFIGTGLLGSGMVEAMLGRGESVTIWNRTAEKARALEGLGARVAAAPEDAVADAERVHLALPDDAVVDQMLARISPRLSPAAIVIDHSTTAPAATRRRLRRAASEGIRFVHAPVFMSPQMCRDCAGLMLVSGHRQIFESVRPALEKMTGEVWYLGEREDLAAAYKLFGNSMLFVIRAGIADVFAMAKGVGVPPEDAASVFSRFKVGGLVAAFAQKMAAADFSATFELTMARKDLRLMIEAAGAEPLIVLPAIAQRVDEAISSGHGKDDLGVIAAASLGVAR
jgi:3-hydroxyisobutyrate dehydrogenase